MPNFLKYDVIYILDPNSTVEEIAAVSTKVEQIVADFKGTVLKKDEWGKRRLAYMVKKNREGHYVFFHVSIAPDAVAEIQRNLRLMEKVIKFSIVKDDISHLKAIVKPPRVKTSTTEGTGHRPSAPRPHSSSHTSSSMPTSAPQAPKAAEVPVAPPAAPVAAPAPSTNP